MQSIKLYIFFATVCASVLGKRNPAAIAILFFKLQQLMSQQQFTFFIFPENACHVTLTKLTDFDRQYLCGPNLIRICRKNICRKLICCLNSILSGFLLITYREKEKVWGLRGEFIKRIELLLSLTNQQLVSMTPTFCFSRWYFHLILLARESFRSWLFSPVFFSSI